MKCHRQSKAYRYYICTVRYLIHAITSVIVSLVFIAILCRIQVGNW